MTRAQRKIRARKLNTVGLSSVHLARETPADMSANPNRGKHSAARLDCLNERAERAVREARRDYRPLTVHTPIARARKAPRTTSYTI